MFNRGYPIKRRRVRSKLRKYYVKQSSLDASMIMHSKGYLANVGKAVTTEVVLASLQIKFIVRSGFHSVGRQVDGA